MVEKTASIEAVGPGNLGGGTPKHIKPPGPGPQGPKMKEKPKDIKPRFEIAKTKQGGAQKHKHDEEEGKALDLKDYLSRNYP